MDRDKKNARRRQYYQKNREKLLEQKCQYNQEHREEKREYQRRYRQEYPERCRNSQRLYRQRHPEKRQEESYRYNQKLKLDVIGHYSNEAFECDRCGFDKNINGLTIDHITGGGLAHLRKLGKGKRGSGFYRWLRMNSYPKGFQVLCGTCQLIKSIEEDRWNKK